jgi:hypothetical protein
MLSWLFNIFTVNIRTAVCCFLSTLQANFNYNSELRPDEFQYSLVKGIRSRCKYYVHEEFPLSSKSFVIYQTTLIDLLIDWLVWGFGALSPDAPRPFIPALSAPTIFHGSPAALVKRQMAPMVWLLTFSGSKKKEPRCACLIEAKASHRQRMWAEVSSSAPHFLHIGLSVSPIKWRCLRRVLCPVRSPVTTLDWALVREKSLILLPRLGPEICSRTCRWEPPRFHHRLRCWFSNQRLILVRKSCREIPKAGFGPTKSEAEPFLASPSAVSLPRTPACPGTQ